MGRPLSFRRTATLALGAMLVISAPVLVVPAASAGELQSIDSVEDQSANDRIELTEPNSGEERAPQPGNGAPDEAEPAQAAESSSESVASESAQPQVAENIEGGTLTWGISENWRKYITGNIANGHFLAEEPAVLNDDDTVTWVDGSGAVDLEAGTGTFEYQGGLIAQGHPGHGGHEWALDQTLSDARIELTSTTSAVFSAEVTQPLTDYAPEYQGERVEMVDLSFDEGDLLDGVVTASGTFTEDGAQVYNNMNEDFQPDAPVEDVRFGIGVEAPGSKKSTTVSLKADPSTAYEGEYIALDAIAKTRDTEQPVAGTVSFKRGSSELGKKKVDTDDGSASLAVKTLAVGDHEITATFTPEDIEGYTASTSSAVGVKVVKRSGGGGAESVVGSMEWGIKKSFRDYVVGNIAKGKFTVKDGAKQGSGNGVFTYPQASGGKNWNGSTGSVQYAGNVNVYGHGGQMNVNIPNPSIHVKSSSSADLRIPFKGKTITLATIDLGSAVKQNLGGDAVRFVGADVKLSSVGANQVFVNDSGTGPAAPFYKTGEVMDKISFTIGAGSQHGLSGEQGGNAGGGGESANQDQATPAAASSSESAGSLTWPISEAFVAYTTCAGKERFGYGHCAKGSIDTSGVGDGYVFPQATGGDWDKESQTGTVEFSGVVKFNGYGLTMFQVANPSIEVNSATSATLHTGNNTAYGEATYPLDLSAAEKTEGPDGEVTWSGVTVSGTLVGTTASQSIGLDDLTFTVGTPSSAEFGDSESSSESAKVAKSAPTKAAESASLASDEEEPLFAAMFGPNGMQPWEWWLSAGALVAIGACTTILTLKQRRNLAAVRELGMP